MRPPSNTSNSFVGCANEATKREPMVQVALSELHHKLAMLDEKMDQLITRLGPVSNPMCPLPAPRVVAAEDVSVPLVVSSLQQSISAVERLDTTVAELVARLEV